MSDQQYPQFPQYPEQPRYPGQQGPPPGPPYPQYGYGPANYGPPPDNHLVWAILTTVLCCMPLGIVSIVKSNQVASLWAQGLHAEARQAADDAKKWAIWSAATMGILVGLYVVFLIVMIVVFGFAATELTPT
ncbi:interferon-induced transmembrane protein [Prauserella shujinwangii]|uniref:Interferon-induced transmembrane protein n=1 Tax=Prauserella shujinwangii TaxID=1453103 RepID=A0A2T0LTN9_9PSEU|nr:CD225/dispanin family protein [Prauserella shujinwangii]PRX47100.1 interferon-induced transmembrane protein [Prauserella shujinwangii]